MVQQAPLSTHFGLLDRLMQFYPAQFVDEIARFAIDVNSRQLEGREPQAISPFVHRREGKSFLYFGLRDETNLKWIRRWKLSAEELPLLLNTQEAVVGEVSLSTQVWATVRWHSSH